MISYPPALRRTGFVAPRAIGAMGVAVMEARSAGGSGAHTRSSAPEMPAAPRTGPRPERRVVLRLWLPVTPLFILLAPFAFLLAPLLYWVPKYGSRPFATVAGVGRVLLSLGGTNVDVETPDALVRIRLF